jgi:hypothetical protein
MAAPGRCRLRWLHRNRLHQSFRLRDGSTWLDDLRFSITRSALHVLLTDDAGLAPPASPFTFLGLVSRLPAGKATRSSC